ncbi:MAG: PKD domain-containing protein [Candidatus Bathyarchaeia archaeon]
MMNNLWKKLSNCLWISLIISAMLLSNVHVMAGNEYSIQQAPTKVRVIPSPIEFKGGNATGQEFDVAVVVENVTNLYGIDINMTWDITYLEYVSHEFTMPVTDYPNPIPPSPYPGILNGPLITTIEDVNPTAGYIRVGKATMAQPPPPSFNGNGTVFVVKFRVKYHPQEADTVTYLHLASTDLAGKMPPGPLIIPHERQDGVVILRSYFEYPPMPLLDLRINGDKEYNAIRIGERFNVSVWLMGEGGVDLDPFWDISGFDFTVNFNSTLLEAVDVKIDPANWWLGFYPGGVQVFAESIDNTVGRVKIAFIGLPDPTQTPPHDPPNGKGVLAIVTFHVIYESETYPPPSAPIWLENPLPLALIDLYSENDLINLETPVSTDWHELTPTYCKHFNVTFWEDVDGDGRLSPNDQIHLLDKETGKWLPYRVHAVPVTMRVDILPFEYTDEYHEGTTIFTNTWPPYHALLSGLKLDPAYPVITWPPTYVPVNLTLSYAALDVSSVEVEFPNGTRRLLTENTEWEWFYGSDQLEIKIPLGVPKSCAFVEGVNMTTGWEGYVPKGRVILPDQTTGWIHRFVVTPVKDRIDLYVTIVDSAEFNVTRTYAIYLNETLIETGELTYLGEPIELYTVINDIDPGYYVLNFTLDSPDDKPWSVEIYGALFYSYEDEFYTEGNVTISSPLTVDFTADPPTLTVLPLGERGGYLWMNIDADGDGDAEPGWYWNMGYDYAPNNPVVAIAPTWTGTEPTDRFPLGTVVTIDYMAECTKMWVNYTAIEPTKWIKSAIGAADFPFTAPLTTEWKELMPYPDKQHVITGWTDTDGNHRLSIGDIIQLYDVETGETKPANITLLATGLTVIQKPVICLADTSDPFYGQVAIVDVAGFPHPERPMCPWHNKAYSVPIPHKTEPATYTAPTRGPIANFTYTPSEPVQFEEITFDASLSYSPANKTIVSYVWDFGDGSPVVVESDPITTHAYLSSGDFLVSLIVTDEDYVNSSAFVVSIHVASWPSPVANFTYSPTMPIECETLIFDASLSYSPMGAEIVSYVWDFGDGSPVVVESDPITTHAYAYAGSYKVTLTVKDLYNSTNSISTHLLITRGFAALNVETDVGSIYFVGELAEFRFLVSFLGEPSNATKLSAKLYGPNKQMIAKYVYPTNITLFATGVYSITYEVGAAAGVYTLVVEVEYSSLKASGLKSFLVSATLNNWDAIITDIKDEIATVVVPTLGEIKLNLTSINATLSNLIVNSKGEILAELDTALGSITAKLNTINTAITAIDGNVVDIKTSVGDIQATLGGLQSTLTLGLAATAILSIIAVLLAALILLTLKKK